MKFPGKYADVNGLRMYYEIHGTGRPLVLLHGGGSTIDTTFGKVIEPLAKTRQVIGIEQQGHGRTADIDRPLTFDQMADDTAALLKQLNIEKADFFGFSNGGDIAMQVAIRHPELVRKLVVASAFFKNDGLYPEFKESFKKPATPDDMPASLRDAYLKVAPQPQNLPTLITKSVKMMSGFKDWPAKDIQSINSPTLVMLGDADIIRPEHAVEMFRLLPHSQLAVFPGSDHGGYLGEASSQQRCGYCPASAVSMIETFLDAAMPEHNKTENK